MSRTVHISALIIACAVVIFVVFFVLYRREHDVALPPPPPDAPYRDARLPVNERIEDLLARMTLAEKVGQMALVEKNSVHNTGDIAGFGLGGMLSGAGAKPATNTPEGWRGMIDAFDRVSRASRLGIPLIYGVDAIHGHGNVPGATIFPHAIGLGASDDEDLVAAVARATKEELRATGVTWSYSPDLDLPKDIRWGRAYETFSDDPARAARLGAAYIHGLSDDADPVIATAKHFIGLGSMQWGSSSNKNFKIDQGTTAVDADALRAQWLPPFKAAVDAGVQAVMVGLNSYGDAKLSANQALITDTLKGELGFKGFVVSDWYGVYEMPGGDYDNAVTAINAGVDMVMLPFDYTTFIGNVVRAVGRGDIAESRIDDAVRRILRAKFESGLFDHSSQAGDLAVIGNATHRALAREAVAKSAVLLKDPKDVLPLRGIERIRIGGSAADNVGRQSGAWTVEWQGIDGNWLSGATSILEGIRKTAPRADIHHATGASEDMSIADVGIAVVGEAPYAEGWGDEAEPRLSPEDLEMIDYLKKTSRTLIVVLVTGRPLFLGDLLENADALVVAWLPGSEGAGVADVLFGKTPFSGTLPLPWPRSISQLPIRPDGSTADGTAPLFPRGFGLK